MSEYTSSLLNTIHQFVPGFKLTLMATECMVHAVRRGTSIISGTATLLKFVRIKGVTRKAVQGHAHIQKFTQRFAATKSFLTTK